MSSGIRDLRVWQEAVALAGEVVKALRPAARREVATLVTRVMGTAFDAAAAIADGYARHDLAEQRDRYGAARRELVRLDTELAAARQGELLGAAAHAALADRIQVVQRILAGYLVYLERQLEMPPPPGVMRLPVPGAGASLQLRPPAGPHAVGQAAGAGAGAGAGPAANPGAGPGSGPGVTPGTSPPAPGPLGGAAPRMAVRETFDEVDGA